MRAAARGHDREVSGPRAHAGQQPMHLHVHTRDFWGGAEKQNRMRIHEKEEAQGEAGVEHDCEGEEGKTCERVVAAMELGRRRRRRAEDDNELRGRGEGAGGVGQEEEPQEGDDDEGRRRPT